MFRYWKMNYFRYTYTLKTATLIHEKRATVHLLLRVVIII
jgi:hypothetical protein